MAAYGAQIKEGKTPAAAEAYLKALFKNVVSQDSSARNALQTFLAGRGDALIDYEDEAIADQKKGAAIEYVIPNAHDPDPEPDRRRRLGTRAASKFVSYLLSPAGQKIWAEKGYRPVIPGVAAPGQFPTPTGLFTIDDLGGWNAVDKQFFEPETGIVTKIEQSLGVSTCEMSTPSAPAVGAQAPESARRPRRRARGGARSARACSASTCRCSCCCRSRRCWRRPAAAGWTRSGAR